MHPRAPSLILPLFFLAACGGTTPATTETRPTAISMTETASAAPPASAAPISSAIASASATPNAPALPPPSPWVAGVSLYDQIQKDVGDGSEILILASFSDPKTAGTIFAVSSADPTRRKQFDAANADRLFVDQYTKVIWFTHYTEQAVELHMIDLLSTSPKSELVLSAPSDCGCIGWFNVKYRGGLATPEDTGAASESDGYGVMLRLDEASPRVELVYIPGGGKGGESLPKKDRPVVATPTLSTELATRLAEIAKRSKGKKPGPTPTKLPKVLGAFADGCVANPKLKPKAGETGMDEIWCGDAETLDGTKFIRVVAGMMVGASTVAWWRIYDPTGKLPTAELPQFHSAIVSPSGKWAFLDYNLVDLTTMKLTMPDTCGGFLDGAVDFPSRTHWRPDFQ
jgi:hypothetical protein